MGLDKCISFIISSILLFYSAETKKINTRLIPIVVNNSFANQFPGIKAGWEKDAEIITKSDGKILSGAAIKGKDLLFTDKSKCIKEIKDQNFFLHL